MKLLILLLALLDLACPPGHIKKRDGHNNWKCVPVNPLPVQLLFFTVSDGIARWETASEDNASHFIVEGSTSCVSWVQTATLPAQGPGRYSTSVHPYNYYRLRQVDLDGQQEIYRMVYNPIKSKPRNYEYNIIGQRISKNL